MALADARAQDSPDSAVEEGDDEDELEPPPKEASSKLLPLRLRKRLFFKYEKRIRDMSNLEKIFEYFGTQRSPEGLKMMDARDVVRALVPTYPPHDSAVERAGFLDGEHASQVEEAAVVQSVFSRLDTNQDGLITFAEFVLVVVLLSIPEADVQTIFRVVDEDESGSIDQDEFRQILALLERRAGVQKQFHRRVGRESYQTDQGVDGMLQLFFGKKRSRGMNLKRLRSFLAELHNDLVRLEFCHYDIDGDGRIGGHDFGAAMVTAAQMGVVDRLLDRVDDMPPELARHRFSLAEFKQVDTMRRQLHDLKVALFFCNEIQSTMDKPKFVHLVQKMVGLKLSDKVADLVLYMFGDADGNLDTALFVDCMKRRQRVPGTKSVSIEGDGEQRKGFPAWWACVKQCTNNEDD